jgi:hypothetical protein
VLGDYDKVDLPVSLATNLEVREDARRNAASLKVSLEASKKLALARDFD